MIFATETIFGRRPDLDNLLKPFLDALHSTAFSEAPGKDSCIVKLTASKEWRGGAAVT
jgi:Holliday junction resolvase RusA-like endonuclease